MRMAMSSRFLQLLQQIRLFSVDGMEPLTPAKDFVGTASVNVLQIEVPDRYCKLSTDRLEHKRCSCLI